MITGELGNWEFLIKKGKIENINLNARKRQKDHFQVIIYHTSFLLTMRNSYAVNLKKYSALEMNEDTLGKFMITQKQLSIVINSWTLFLMTSKEISRKG